MSTPSTKPKAKKKKKPETGLIKPVAKWLTETGWSVTEELEVLIDVNSLKRFQADMVAVRGDIIAVFEGKTALNERVICQAAKWIPYCHKSTCIVPHPGHCPPDEHKARLKTARNLGVGVMYVTAGGEIRIYDGNKAPHNPKPLINPIAFALGQAARQLAAGGKHQPAGSPAPLGARGQRTHGDFAAARAYIEEHGPQTVKALPLSKAERNKLTLMTRRGELGRTGLTCDKRAAPWVYDVQPQETAH